MQEFIINEREEGQTLHKYLCKLLPTAGSGFLFKTLRKKNIKLNDSKASGNEKLKSGDHIKIYFTDDTIATFRGSSDLTQKLNHATGKIDVLYENQHYLVINKPAGILSQKAKPSDISINEEMIAYLLQKGEITEETLGGFKPSVCNRLDRNTSGIILAGKTIHGLQTLSEALKERSIHKFYRCFVLGEVKAFASHKAYLIKDERTNQVSISKKAIPGASEIETEYRPIRSMVLPYGNNTISVTELEVLLITGKTHQIRAHLSSLGYPLLGDPKYGNMKLNSYLAKKYHINRQLLHAYRIEMPSIKLNITAPYPSDFHFEGIN